MPRFLTSIDLTKNELQNVRLHNLTGHPTSPVLGQMYYNTTGNEFYIWNGTTWKSYADSAGSMSVHDNTYHSVTFEDSANKENTTIDTSTTKYPTVNLLKTGLELKVDIVAGMGLSQESYTTTEKTKLSGIEEGAQVNVATNIAEGTRTTTTVPVTSSTGTGATLSAATTSLAGVMTSDDKTKLDGVEASANNYTHPANHNPSIITQDASNRFVTDSEKGIWNAKSDLALGELSTDAYRGDRGKTAYDHSLLVTGNPHAVTKAEVGLTNVEDKSSATIRGEITSSNITTALTFTPEDASKKGAIDGYAGLDANAKVPLTQLPDASKQQTYVVADLTARDALTGLISGDKSFITSTSDSYIWDGSAWQIVSMANWENVNLDYGNITNPPTLLVLGETETTAYRGDHGLAAYNHSLAAHAPSDAQKNSDILKTEIEAVLTGEISTHTHVPSSLKHAEDIGDGALTTFTVTHNFATRDVFVTVREVASPYEIVYADIEATTTNAITVSFATAPTLNQYRVVVIG